MIMDFESKNKNGGMSKHWAVKTLNSNNSLPTFTTDIDAFKIYLPTSNRLNNFLKSSGKTTNDTSNTITYTKKLLNRKTYLKSVDYSSNTFITHTSVKTKKNVKHLASILFLTTNCITTTPSNLNTWYSTININFLRKERLYTKLKYSRSPAYDIVSGGAAAIFAGFIGFLISEKFGFELADSGDFYYLFMYLVFIAFFSRPLVTTLDIDNGVYGVFKFKDIRLFYLNVISLIILKLKYFFNKK
jgi:hypothetical protein